MTGISGEKAKLLLAQFGSNTIASAKKASLLSKFVHQFSDITVIILIIAAGIAMFIGMYEGKTDEMTDAYLILAIVFINAIIGFIQEYRSEQAVEALKKMTAPTAKVFRDGKEIIIAASEIVPGDVISLEAGDRLPADGTVVESNALKVDESILTGESVPVSKDARSHDTEMRRLFMGTAVVNGNGKALITATGMRTEFGKIAHLTGSTQKDKSPLQKEMSGIGVFIGKFAIGISAILFFVGIYLQGFTLIQSLIFAVAVAVAVVPEGLPAIITITLALGMQRLAKKRALVKQLSSVETLGATTVICTDKTGTLTQNQMVATRILLGTSEVSEVTGVGYSPEQGEVDAPNREHFALEKITMISLHCNNARIEKEGDKWITFGDPTEGALMTLGQKIERQFSVKIPQTRRIAEFPFDPVRKRMSIVTLQGTEHMVLAKGSPEAILDICTHIVSGSETIPMTTQHRSSILKEYERFGSRGLRVLACAYTSRKDNPKTESEAESGLTYVGLVGLLDPPREEVSAAVAACKEAGIRIIVITGDFGPTAMAIGEKIGLERKSTPLFTGKDLDALEEKDLLVTLTKHHDLIFSRVSPEHKLRIVSALKSQGEVVAVTGDGVNDAPALKRADIGVAMGITGTEVSKEAANMVLVDDSFASIVSAVGEGRVIYENLRKFIWFIMSCNIGEVLVIIGALIAGLPIPLTAALLLAVNIGTDLFPALALGLEEGEEGTMQKKPRNPSERILTKRFVARQCYIALLIAASVLGVFWMFLEHSHEKAITAAFAALVMTQIFNALNARSEHTSIFRLPINPIMVYALIISIGMMLSIVHVPFISNLFHTTPLLFHEWLLVIAGSVIILIAEEMRKLIAPNIFRG